MSEITDAITVLTNTFNNNGKAIMKSTANYQYIIDKYKSDFISGDNINAIVNATSAIAVYNPDSTLAPFENVYSTVRVNNIFDFRDITVSCKYQEHLASNVIDFSGTIDADKVRFYPIAYSITGGMGGQYAQPGIDTTNNSFLSYRTADSYIRSGTMLVDDTALYTPTVSNRNNQCFCPFEPIGDGDNRQTYTRDFKKVTGFAFVNRISKYTMNSHSVGFKAPIADGNLPYNQPGYNTIRTLYDDYTNTNNHIPKNGVTYQFLYTNKTTCSLLTFGTPDNVIKSSVTSFVEPLLDFNGMNGADSDIPYGYAKDMALYPNEKDYSGTIKIGLCSANDTNLYSLAQSVIPFAMAELDIVSQSAGPILLLRAYSAGQTLPPNNAGLKVAPCNGFFNFACCTDPEANWTPRTPCDSSFLPANDYQDLSEKLAFVRSDSSIPSGKNYSIIQINNKAY